jgi:hypothetical protein
MSTIPAFVPLGSAGLAAQAVRGSADLDPRLTRSNYFDGRLLTADDLTRDQLYLDRRLREFGRVIGTGVLTGLEAALDVRSGVISVQKGLGVSAAGRVLELREPLTADLVGERAGIVTQNGGAYARLPRGLYALVLIYAEQGDGRAEVFPRDLAAPRTGEFSIIAEGMALGLALLTGLSPVGRALAIRAELMARAARGSLDLPELPEDGLALGVLAIADDRPQWLDATLLRQPARANPDADDIQYDLARRYEALLADVLAERRATGLGGDFAAAAYFPLLPPAGSAPKDAFDPLQGRQGFFPAQHNVWVAPIRAGDLALVLRESMPLPPLDLNDPNAADIIVLAPLSPADYAALAPALESALPEPSAPPPLKLPRLDPLRLRLNPLPARHALDLDRDTWERIWARVPADAVRYVRRPTRTAETAVSGIVLARGSLLPPPPAEPDEAEAPVPPVVIVDENALLLSRLDWDGLAALRPPRGGLAEEAFAQLREAFVDNADVVFACAELLTLIERTWDELTWPTLLAVAEREALRDLAKQLAEQQQSDASTPKAMAELLVQLGIGDALLEGWIKAAENA